VTTTYKWRASGTMLLMLCMSFVQAQTLAERRSAELASWAPSPNDSAQSTQTSPAPGTLPPAAETPPAGPSTTSISDAPAPTSGADVSLETQTDSDQPSVPPPVSQEERAALQIRQQESQRILGVVPNFNTSYVQDAAPLSRKQKFGLAFKSAIDFGTILVAGVDAAYSQETKAFPAYGQGVQGYAKYLGASYADTFDGTMLGNALFPAILKQDPRYFRKGTGTFTYRFLYAVSTTFWCKNDNGSRGPNYSNLLGNLAAGGISNLYYPAADRGASLTIQRGLVVTAEGAIGGVFEEFWPDIARKVLKDRMTKLQPNVPLPAPTTIAHAPPQ
jgi:hypothetical protein